MDMNHARLPIPPLRRVTFTAKRPLRVAFHEEYPSILCQTGATKTRSAQKFFRAIDSSCETSTWATTYNRNQRTHPCRWKNVMPNTSKLSPEVVRRLRSLAH